MIPWPKDITVRFGDSKTLFFRIRERVWNPALNGGAGGWEAGPYRDLTGWSVLSQIRATTEAPAILATFTPEIGDQGDPDQLGSVWLRLTAVQTAGIDRALSTGVWDVQLTDPGGDVLTYAEGDVTFTRDVSRV